MKKLVSIVIPNWFHGIPGKICTDGDEALWFAKHCFERIKKFTNIDYELILIDNGSIHGQDLMKKYADVLITNKKNLGFAKACNQGFEAAKGEWIICMNNDVFIWQDAFEIMIKDYKSNPNIGVLMPALMKECKRGDEALKIEFPNLQQNYGVIAPGAEFGSLWLIKKDFFDTLKEAAKCEQFPEGYYFDPTFFPGMGEDRQLWARVRMAGKQTYRTHNVRIFHQGNVTFNTFPNRKKYTTANREYLAKWKKEKGIL